MISLKKPTTGNAASWRGNIVGTVLSYSEDKKGVLVRIENFQEGNAMFGKTAYVTLDDTYVPKSDKSRRPEIIDFIKGKHPMPATPVGGMIYLTGCSLAQDKKPEGADYTLNARWLNFVRQSAEHLKVYGLVTGGKYIRDGVETESYRITTFDKDAATEVAPEKLIDSIASHIARVRAENGNPAMLINTIDQNGVVNGTMLIPSFLRLTEDGEWVAPETEDEIKSELARKVAKDACRAEFEAAHGFQLMPGVTYSATKINPGVQKNLGDAIRQSTDKDGNVYATNMMISLIESEGRAGEKRPMVTQAFPLTKRSNPTEVLAEIHNRDLVGGTVARDDVAESASQAASSAADLEESPDPADSLFDEADEVPHDAAPAVPRRRAGLGM